MHIFVDPVLLAVPKPGDTPSGYEQLQEDYATHLLDWKDEFCRKKHHFFMSAECIDALFQDNCFPDASSLKSCLGLTGLLDKLSPQDISTVAFQLATNVPHLESVFPGTDLQRIEVEDATFFIHPDLLKRLPPTVATAFRRSLARVAWLRATATPVADDTPDPADLLLATHPVGDEKMTSVRAEILAENLLTVENELPLVTHPYDLIRFAGLIELWDDPNAATAYTLATKNLTPCYGYRFHPDFTDSLSKLEFHRPGHVAHLESTYMLCAQVASNAVLPSADLHPHGEPGSGGIRSGRWKAFRASISAHNTGYRLIFWKSNRNEYVFMKAALHNDFTIGLAPDS